MRFFRRPKPPDPETVRKTQEVKEESYEKLKKWAEETGDSRLLAFVTEKERALRRLGYEQDVIRRGAR
jgi:hypothetical protein